MGEKYISIKKASEVLGVTPLTLRNWDKKGKFKALRHPINNYRVYKTEEIDRLLKEMETAVFTRNIKKVKKLEIKHE
ncbi:MAG: MerR family DNA-binding transcriptional regulator [Patescibacteria group bacterium]